VTLVATLTALGFGPGLQLEGAMNWSSFGLFVRQGLVPTLRLGGMIVLACLYVHKSLRVRLAVEVTGERLVFLPACYPDLNPIEQAFAKLNQGLRAASSRATDKVMAATQDLYPRKTATDARGFYRHAGNFLKEPV
jgi:transposase